MTDIQARLDNKQQYLKGICENMKNKINDNNLLLSTTYLNYGWIL